MSNAANSRGTALARSLQSYLLQPSLSALMAHARIVNILPVYKHNAHQHQDKMAQTFVMPLHAKG